MTDHTARLWQSYAAHGPVSFRHASLAQAGEFSGFAQRADLRHAPIFDVPQASEARIPIVGAQPAGLGEFGGGSSRLAGKAVGGSEIAANH